MKVFITRKIPKAGIDLLKKRGYNVVLHDKDSISESDLIRSALDADAILCNLSSKFSEDVLDKLKKVKVISNYAVGYNNIDIQAATHRNIAITNTPGVLTDATADIAMSLILATTRNLIEADKFMRQGKFKGWEPMLFLGIDIKDKTLGILGMGRIGQAVAKRANAFGMKLIYTDSGKNLNPGNEFSAKRVSLNTLLKKSDVLSLHVPLTPKTYHLLGRKELSIMKKSSIIINTARGEVIDEKILIEFLKKGRIHAAGFDVYEGEPKVNKDLLKLINVVMLPHIGSATIETRNKMSLIAAKNIINVLSGKRPEFIVNPEIYS